MCDYYHVYSVIIWPPWSPPLYIPAVCATTSMQIQILFLLRKVRRGGFHCSSYRRDCSCHFLRSILLNEI